MAFAVPGLKSSKFESVWSLLRGEHVEEHVPVHVVEGVDVHAHGLGHAAQIHAERL